ncbi:uncharacterized protein T551_03335 [Pneumocystis jirovecii RU7]|uniref:Yos1-like protein n=1 Tax=Pneumocystis jirovecii (strain RU7) TaxID=1408657 RepID=A0A0W4ZES0_PNEJ7|nr:uncharacterized protein T551_03335 [Pneumocystis jirovecii RU7]KTW26873.1 hypothetical protein T551_03335 [Pneumocystis jirovecii RU7]
MFGLVSLLLVNAIAVLSEDRFLAKIGFHGKIDYGFENNSMSSVKFKIINLMNAVRTLMRIPLIVINTLVMIYLLTLG